MSNFPYFNKRQGQGLALDNIWAPEQSAWETFKMQTDVSMQENITPQLWRAAQNDAEKNRIYDLDKEYKEKKLSSTSGFTQFAAQSSGWLVGNLADPLDLAILAFSGGTATVASKVLVQQGLKKRLAQGAIMGATYSSAKEPLIQATQDEAGYDKSSLGATERLVESTVAFPVLGEVAHKVGGAVKGLFPKKTGSSFLDKSNAKVLETENKKYVDESLTAFKESFTDPSVQKKVLSVVEKSHKSDINLLLQDVEKLQDVKKDIRSKFASTKDLARINYLEDKISSGLSQIEETELNNLVHKNQDKIVVRDNQTKLIDTLITNRNILVQGEDRISDKALQIISNQAENGKKVNINLKPKTIEESIASVKSSPLIETEKLAVNVEEVSLKGIEKELPEISYAIDQIDQAVSSKALDKDAMHFLQETRNKFKTQLQYSQHRAEKLVEELATYKDIKTGLRVLTDKISNESNGYFAYHSNKLYTQLQKEGLLKVFEKGAVHWGKELSRLNGAKELSTGLKSAQRVAELLHSNSQKILHRAKNSGHIINTLEGRVVKQTHDRIKIKSQGFEKWKNFITPLIDSSKTSIEEDVLLKAYNNIIQGKNNAKEGIKLLGSEKVQSIMHSLGINIGKHNPRTIHFNSIDNAYLYNQEYGMHGWGKQYFVDLKNLTAKTIQSENLGVYPEHALKYVRKVLSEKKELPSDFVERVMSPLKLTRDKLNNYDSAQLWGDRLRSYTSLCMLGKSMLSSIPDAFTSYVATRVIGSSRMSSLGSTFKGLMYMVKPKERKEALELTNVVVTGALSDFFNRLGLEVSATRPQNFQKLTHLLYKINGQQLWDESLKAGVSEGVVKYVNSLAKKSTWEKLPTALQTSLTENGINKKEWASLAKIDKDIIPANISNEVLRSKYQGFLIDITHKAIPTGVRANDQYIMQGHKSSSHSPVLREFATSWLQFKHFPIMFCRHQLAPLFRSATPLTEQSSGTLGVLKDLGSSPSVWGSSAALIAGVLSLEYIAKETKEVVSGKKSLEDTFSPTEDDITDVIKKGSALGIYQFILSGISSTNPYNNPFVPASYAPIKNTSQIISKIGDKDFVPTLIDKGSKTIPFNNLFYTDYLLKSSINSYLKQQYPVYQHKKGRLKKK